MTDNTPVTEKPASDTPAAGEPQVEVRKGGVKPSAVAFGVIVVVAAAFGLYEVTHRTSKQVAHTGACARSLDLAQTADPLVHGEIAALNLAQKPNALAPIAFDDADGNKTSIGAFKGKTILLNLWATWCVPCRTEMPALDKLQADLGSDKFAVVPVNIDTVRLDKARSFLKDVGAASLPFYSDHTADILQTLKQNQKIVGLPTTLLIGGDGCEIGTMAGPAQWDSPEAKALIRTIERPSSAPSQT